MNYLLAGAGFTLITVLALAVRFCLEQIDDLHVRVIAVESLVLAEATA